jgi:hypothetical protein
MKLLRHILLLLLTFAVLVSSTGLSVGMHLCAGEISNFNLFGQSQPCPMEEQKEKLPPCHHMGGEAIPLESSASDCCEDQTLSVDKVDLLTSSSKALAATPDVALVAVVAVVWSYLFGLHQPFFSPISEYSPPSLARNIPVLVQSFLL